MKYVKDAILEHLAGEGVELIFGNPGTTEETLLERLAQRRIPRYVMGLQESVVIAMADAYSRATGRVGVAQVHAAVGLGNAMGMLYQARRSGTAILVLAGEAHAGDDSYDGFLEADLTALARPVTKWATRLETPQTALRTLRRAMTIASSAPRGPVLVALPMDVLDMPSTESSQGHGAISTRVCPERHTVDQFVNALLSASDPMLLVGDGVATSGAQAEVHRLADVLGAPIYGADFGDLSVSMKHPLFAGTLGHAFGDDTAVITRRSDVVFALGTPLFSELFPSKAQYFSEGCRLLQVDANAWEVGKNFPTHLGVVADPLTTLQAIMSRLLELETKSTSEKARLRYEHVREDISQARVARELRYASQPSSATQMSPAELMRTVAQGLPPDAAVFDEAITCTDELQHYLMPDDPSKYVLGRGGCIGVGWPGGVALGLVKPSRPVLAVSGDGSALFVVQALWTAVRERLRIVFLVCNNQSYRILKVNLLRYGADRGVATHTFPYADLDDPTIDWVSLAAAFGADGRVALNVGEVGAHLDAAWSRPGVHVIDARVDGSVEPNVSAPQRVGHGSR